MSAIRGRWLVIPRLRSHKVRVMPCAQTPRPSAQSPGPVLLLMRPESDILLSELELRIYTQVRREGGGKPADECRIRSN